MKIAVIGAGAIGGLVAGYLKLNQVDVSLIGHADTVTAIKDKGLVISGVRGENRIKLAAGERLSEKPELVILTTKTQDIEVAIKDNLDFLKSAVILTTQNGIRADELAAKYLPSQKIISSIVMFGATSLEPGKIVHNFEGSWIMGSIFGSSQEELKAVSLVLEQVFKVVLSDQIKGMKYLKIFVNANNCLPAILGMSMQEAFADIEVSSISIAIWKEGLKIIRQSGIDLISLPDFSLERLEKLAALPTQEAAKIFSQIMSGLSKEPLYGSILQSIKRGRSSEIDYLNGEFLRLAKEKSLSAPLNEKLVAMVHSVEKNKKFFSKEELFSQTKGLFN